MTWWMVPAASVALYGGVLALLWWEGRRRARQALAWWRLVSLTPPGRRHERHVRRRLGMPPGHPEHVTTPPSRRDDRALARVQAELWPEGEWADVIRFHLEGEL